MDTQRLTAILLIAGAAILLVSGLFGPQGIYQEPDLQKRVQIIEENKTGWYIAQSLLGLSVLLTAAGFFVLNIRLYKVANPWPHTLGATAFIFGAISGFIFLYRQTTDPLGAYGGAYSGMESLYYWLALIGLLLFGIAFLQAGLPAWLGYLTIGATVLFSIVFFLVSGARFLTPGLVFLLSLVIGIFFIRK